MSEDDLVTAGGFEWTRGKSVLAILPITSYEHLVMHAPTIRAVLGPGAG